VYQLSVNGNEKIRHKSWLCKNSDHWSDQCTTFAALTYENRLKEAKENHVCYSCLKQAGRKHNAANFNRRKRCNKSENGEECQAFHHPLLHKPNPVNVVAASEVQNTNVILPVVTANICGQNGQQKQANVLLDAGVQIRFIRITKVGGEGETMKTKAYKVLFCITESGKRYTVKAIGIPKITDDVTAVDMKRISKLLGLEKERIRRGKGRIDMLIGIDHAQLQSGPSKQSAEIVARNTPLGWVVFAGSAMSTEGASQVCDVSLAPHVDLTTFW